MTGPDNTANLFATINAVAPALATFTQERVIKELWSRDGLSPRDRALVTLAILVARNATMAYPHYVNKALDCGLMPAEISELLTHLGFYTSLANAFGAIAAVRTVFEQRGVHVADLPTADSDLLPLGAAVPDAPAWTAFIDERVASISPALQYYTSDLLHGQVWTRPGLAPRNRALATVAALAALGQMHIQPAYLKHARSLGVTHEQFGEALAHVAFYAGWGLAIQASLHAEGCFAAQI